jgi:hypothetical protein
MVRLLAKRWDTRREQPTPLLDRLARQQARQGPQSGHGDGIVVTDEVVMIGMAGDFLTLEAWHGLNPSGDDGPTLTR